MNKIKSISLFIFIALSSLSFAIYIPGGDNYNNYTWVAGQTYTITSNVTFHGNITATGSSGSPVYIQIAENVQATLASGSSFTATGFAPSNGNIIIERYPGGTAPHLSFRALAGSTLRMTNTTITGANRGLTLETSDAIIDQIAIYNPVLCGIRIVDCAPRITRSLFQCTSAADDSIFLYYSAAPANIPQIIGNHFYAGKFGHIELRVPNGTASTFYFEGNYWQGGTPTVTKYLGDFTTYDNYPVLGFSPYTTPMYLTGGAGATGTINNPNFYIFNGETYIINSGSITIASGAALHLGVNRNNIAATTYTGNSILRFNNGGFSINVLNGGTIHSEGTTIAPNYIRDISGSNTRGTWGEIDLAAGSTGYFANTSIANAVTALDIQTAALTLTNVTLNYNTTAVNSNTNVTISNNYFGNNTTALRITGGTPTVQGNRIVGNTTAFNVSGGTLAVGQIQNNRITGATTFVTSSTGTSGAPVYFERNYWGVATPATANFSGTGTIDYEPWYIDTTLTTTRELAPTATAFIPLDGANIAVAPARLTFNIWEIGYHNGNVDYDLQLDDDPAFTAPYTFSGSKICNSTIFHDISGTLPAGNPFWVPNTEYFWRIRTNSPADTIVMPPWSDSIPSASFILQGPQVDLVLTSDRTFASAGQQVLYTVDFTNNSDPSLGTPLSGVRIVNVIPNDVFFDGQIQLSSIDSSMSSIAISFYSDTAGTALALIGSTITHPASTPDQTYNNPIPAAQNRNVRRIDVVITQLSDSTAGGDQNHGIFRYRTVVK